MWEVEIAMQTQALILVLSDDWLFDLEQITQPLWSSVSSAEWGTNSFRIVTMKLIAKLPTHSQHLKMSFYY